MNFTSLTDWLCWLETLHPTEIDLGLERIQEVAQRLRLGKPARTVFTVAGTNGKGSTVAFLSTILRKSGFSVGTYTSPHLLRYNERVVVNGVMVSDDRLCQAFEAVEAARQNTSLTYFEFGTLAAFLIFEQENLDCAVLEVGLGGRLDAVNLIDPDVAVLTTVALDHEAWLGSTREAIGSEKAGIFRAAKPAVCGEKDLLVTVEQVALEKSARLLRRGIEFDAQLSFADWQWRGLDARGQEVWLQQLPIPQLPFDNAVTAIQALMSSGLSIAEEAIQSGLSEASLMGRYQKIQHGGRLFVLDVAHNPESAAYLANKLQSEKINGKTVAVFAMLSDKDCKEVVRLLAPAFDRWVVSGIEASRGQSAQSLVELVKASGVESAVIAETLPQALRQAQSITTPDDRIVVCGSFYTVTAALEQLECKEEKARG